MIVSTFKSIHKAYVDLKLNLEWEEIAELMMHHNDVANKTDAELYNMVEFKDVTDLTKELGRKYHYIDNVKQSTYDEIPDTVRRCKNNVVSITGIILDIDEDKTIEQTIDILDGIEYVLYTTFRHTPEKHKFRVVIPFSRPLLKEDIAGRQQDIIDTLPSVDNCSFTVSQSFYFHSGKTDNIAYWNKGIMLDPYSFKYKEPVVYEAPQYTQTTTLDDEQLERYKNAVVSSLQTCSGLHYAGKGDNNKAVSVLVSICKSIKLSFSEYDQICAKMADSTSELTKPQVRHSAWVSWSGDRIRKETRDKFIRDYGGVPIRVQSPVTEYTDFLQQMKAKYGNNN